MGFKEWFFLLSWMQLCYCNEAARYPHFDKVHVPIRALPYAARLDVRDRNCGGTVLSHLYVLTNADCVHGPRGVLNRKEIAVLVGSTIISKSTRYQVSIIKVHPMYDDDAQVVSIALIRVRGRIEFNEKVRAVKVAPTGYDWHCDGWPMIGTGLGGPSQQERRVALMYYTNGTVCEQLAGEVPVAESKLICAMVKSDDDCISTMGSGLFWDGYLIGVESGFGSWCNDRSDEAPFLYIDVTGRSYRKWLQHTLEYDDYENEPPWASKKRPGN